MWDELKKLILVGGDIMVQRLQGFSFPAEHPLEAQPNNMEHFNDDKEEDFSSEGSSPLGLTLKKTPSFINLVEMKLAQARQQKKMDEFSSQPMAEKLKASNFPASLLKIGSWERISRHQGDLIAKLYYAKRKLVWEVLEGALKSKIEVQWSDIAAIRAIIRDNEPGILEIELNQPPLYFRETNPQPRKHTLWQQASDFTGGQAPICRRHAVIFPPGTLDKHYEKLLQCDQRLFTLSQKPFPSQEYPYFHPNLYGFSDFPSYLNGCLPEFSPNQHNYPIQNFPAPIIPPHLNSFKPTTGPHFNIVNPNSPMSVMDVPFLDEGGSSSYAYENQGPVVWGDQGVNYGFQGLPSISMAAQGNPLLPSQNYCMNYGEEYGMKNTNDVIQLDNIGSHLLGDSQVVCSNEMSLFETVSSMSSLLEPQQEEANSVRVHPQPISWLPSQDYNMDMNINPSVNKSSYPYVFPEPTLEDFAALDASQEIHHWN